MKTCTLSFDVTYDPTKTNPVKLVESFDFMIGQSLSSNVLDSEGQLEVGAVTAEEVLEENEALPKAGAEWLEARTIIACFLRELHPGMTPESFVHNAAAILARLAHANILTQKL